MNKKWLKFSLYILIILTTVVLTSTVVLGWSYTDFGSTSGSNRGSTQILNLSSNFVSILKPVGYILGVVIVFALAISYMTASPNKKADIKLRTTLYTIGIVLLVTIPTLMDWLGEFGKDLSDTTGSNWGNSEEGEQLELFDSDEPFNINDLFGGLFGDLSGDNGGSGSSGGGAGTSTSTNGSTVTSDPITSNQPITSTNVNSNPAGYVAPASGAQSPGDLKPGDKVYFQVDGNGNINGNNWNDSDYYWIIPENAKMDNSTGKWRVLREGYPPTVLGSQSTSAPNCFSDKKVIPEKIDM